LGTARFGLATGINAGGELAVLRQPLRRAFKRALRRGPLCLVTANFLIGGARLGQIATGARKLLCEFLDRHGVSQLGVPPAPLCEFAELSL